MAQVRGVEYAYVAAIGLGVLAAVLGVSAAVAIARGALGRTGWSVLSSVLGSGTAVVSAIALTVSGVGAPHGGTTPPVAAPTPASTPSASPSAETPASGAPSSGATAVPPPVLGPPEPAGGTPSANGRYTLAAWAQDFSLPGEPLSSVPIGDFTVDVYQVGVFQGVGGGSTGLGGGSEVVLLETVLTYHGAAPIRVGPDLAKPSVAYSFGVTLGYGVDPADAAKHGVPVNGWDEAKTGGVPPSGSVLVWDPGTSYSVGHLLNYARSGEVSVEIKVIEVDDQGAPLTIHDGEAAAVLR